MAGLEAGSVYLPGFVRDGQRAAGADEDSFTLVATALERLPTLDPSGPPAQRVHLVGSYPPVVEWGVSALLGHPVDLATHGGGSEGLREAWAQIEGSLPTAFPQLLVAAELPEREPVGTRSHHGAGAVALRIGAGRSLTTEERSLLLGGPDAVSAARALLASQGGGSSAPPAGATRAPLTFGPAGPFIEAPLAAVSEGAYVSRARYLEELPSRWRLMAEQCGRCGSLTFPARGICRSCSARQGLTPSPLPRDGGRVVATTTIGTGGQPTEFDLQVATLGAYGVVLAEFAPGVRLTLQVTDAAPGELSIGAHVGTRLRRLYPMEGEWRYGRKAVPLERPAPGA